MSLYAREEAVKAIRRYVKAHVQTPAFAANYEQARQEQKPAKPEGRDQNVETTEACLQDLQYWEQNFRLLIMTC